MHDLRHTHASVLIETGWDFKEIQVRLGHASITITMDIYGHLRKHGQVARLDAMNRAFALMAEDEAA
jgi:integrase